MAGKGSVDEASGLLTKHLLLKMAVEKGVGDIHLVNRPAARDGELEDSADRARFDNRGERLREINSSALAETADHPASLVALK